MGESDDQGDHMIFLLDDESVVERRRGNMWEAEVFFTSVRAEREEKGPTFSHKSGPNLFRVHALSEDGPSFISDISTVCGLSFLGDSG